MNLVGKIFTVLIFVMSLLFMGVAVTVYATHTNWREAVVGSNEPGKPKGLQPRLKEARTRNEELKDQKARLEQKLAKESKAAEQVRANPPQACYRYYIRGDLLVQGGRERLASGRGGLTGLNSGRDSQT